MNKKLLIFGLIIIIATGFYMNGLINNDSNFEVTSYGTIFDTPNDMVELISSENGTDVFGYHEGEHFYYVISFNATENPDLYMKFNDMICKGKTYEENGVVFYEQTSQVLGNNFNVWTGVNLAIKDQTIAGSFIKNNKTGECIVCISNNWGNVVDTLEDVDWGDKTVEFNDIVNTTATVEEPVHDDTTTETNNVDNVADEKTYDNADGIGLSDDDYSKQREAKFAQEAKELEEAGLIEDGGEPASDDASASSAN